MLVLALASFGFSTSLFADSAQEYSVKAAITLNFARFTEWPPGTLKDSDPMLNLCVIGDNIVQQAFTEIDKKPVAKKSLQIINLSRIRNLEQCQLLYINGLEKNKTLQLLAEISKLHILTLGEDDEFLENGGMINLEMNDGKIDIKINLNAVKKSNIQVSARVLKLATIVNH